MRSFLFLLLFPLFASAQIVGDAKFDLQRGTSTFAAYTTTDPAAKIANWNPTVVTMRHTVTEAGIVFYFTGRSVGTAHILIQCTNPDGDSYVGVITIQVMLRGVAGEWHDSDAADVLRELDPTAPWAGG